MSEVDQSPLPPRPNSRRKRVWIVTWLLRLLLMVLARVQVFVRVRVTGRTRVPRRGPVIVAANHHAMLDPVLLFGALRRRVAVLAGEFLFRKRLLGALLKWMGTIRVDRGTDAAKLAIDEGVVVLQHGGVVAGFLPGKITPEGGQFVAKTGLARMAIRAGVPIVPVGMKGVSRVASGWARLRLGRRVELNLGEPIHPVRQSDDPDPAEVEALTAQVQHAIYRLAGIWRD